MFLLAPVLALAAFAVLLCTDGDGVFVREAFVILAVLEVALPILPLALLPANAKKLGVAYAVNEIMFITIQMAIVLLLGLSRDESGYPAALCVVMASFAGVAVVSLAIVLHGKDFGPTRRRLRHEL
jgi:hypothetical protein